MKYEAVEIWNKIIDGYEGRSNYRWPDLAVELNEIRNAALEEAANLVMQVRMGELDTDYRGIIYFINEMKRKDAIASKSVTIAERASDTKEGG